MLASTGPSSLLAAASVISLAACFFERDDVGFSSEEARHLGGEFGIERLVDGRKHTTAEEQAAKEITDAAASSEEGPVEASTRPPWLPSSDTWTVTANDFCSTPFVPPALPKANRMAQHISTCGPIQDKASPAYSHQIVFAVDEGHRHRCPRSCGRRRRHAASHRYLTPEVPIIVAVNKVDKPEAMPDRVKKQLPPMASCEKLGWHHCFVDALKKKPNLNLLMEMILPRRRSAGV